MKGGNGGLSKSNNNKTGHWTSAETPPPLVDLIHQNVFLLSSLSQIYLHFKIGDNSPI